MGCSKLRGVGLGDLRSGHVKFELTVLLNATVLNKMNMLYHLVHWYIAQGLVIVLDYDVKQ